MTGKRYSKNEISQIQALVNGGLSNREIAVKLGRSEAGIRNLRYRMGLKSKAENEVKMLFEKRDNLRAEVSELERKKSELSRIVEDLNRKKQTAEIILKLDEVSLRANLVNALNKLRIERPDLFVLSPQEQNLYLLGLFLKAIFT